MKKKIQIKKNIILKFNFFLKNSSSILLININKVKSNKINNFRKNLKNLDTYIYCLKKTLLIKSLIENNLNNLSELYISGQIFVIFIKKDPVEIIKFIKNFINENNRINMIYLYSNKIIYDNKKIEFLNSLLTYKNSIKKFVYLIKEISFNKLFNILILLKNNFKENKKNKCKIKEDNMSYKKEEILEAISNMSIIEISELISMIEEKFSITSSSTYKEEINEKKNEQNEEKNEFNIMLSSIGNNKISVIKSIRSIIDIGLKEAKDLVESFPVMIKENVNKEEAIKIKKILEDSGAKIDLV